MRLVVAALFIVLGATGCGGVEKQERAERSSAMAIAQAVRLIRTGDLVKAQQDLMAARTDTGEDPRRYEEVDYYLATVLTLRGNLHDAHRLIEAHAAAAAERGDPDSAVWMNSLLGWILWAEGDRDRSVDVIESAERSLEAIEDIHAKDVWTERVRWQRVLFLYDRAYAETDEENRSERLTAADTARTEAQPMAPDHLAALAAFVALRAGDKDAAEKSAAEVKIVADTDPAVAWVVTRVLPGEAAARRRLGADVSLVAAVLRRME